MKLGMQVGLGPGHIVLDGYQAPPHPKGHNHPTIFHPYLLRPNGFMDKDATWYGARPRPRRLVLDGDPAPLPQKGGGAPQFSAHVYCNKTARWIKMVLQVLGMEVGPSPADFVLDGDPAPPKKGAEPQIFGPCLLWRNGWMHQDATW